ncbi:MAG: lytic murein transglycosylase B [Pseudomonadales bacterium]|nr:lytic murein transglycosylase B [Pseudomonadales bacterium]
MIKFTHLPLLFKTPKVFCFILLIGVLWGATAQAGDYLQRKEFIQLVNELEKEEAFDRKSLVYLFSDVTRKDSIIKAMTRPAESKEWKEYRPIFVTKKRINQGLSFWKENESLLNDVEKKYGVPAEIIVAIIGVETRYGRNKGGYRVIDALSTLGFDYPKRSKFFLSELKHFLILARDAGLDPAKAKGSYAGAIGMPQFIPSSYRHYAVDYNKDGRTDLIDSNEDTIASIANYFLKHGWEKNAPITAPAKNTHPDLDFFRSHPLKPKLSIAELESKGFSSEQHFDRNQKATPLTFQGAKGEEYWLGLNNFYVEAGLPLALSARHRRHRRSV